MLQFRGYDFKRPVIIAVVAVRMMQPALDEIVHMISVRDGLMSAVDPVNALNWISACGASAFVRVRLVHFNHMFVDVIPVHVMEMAIMQIVRVSLMLNRNVPAIRAVLMGVIFVFDAVAHIKTFFCVYGLYQDNLRCSPAPRNWNN